MGFLLVFHLPYNVIFGAVSHHPCSTEDVGVLEVQKTLNIRILMTERLTTLFTNSFLIVRNVRFANFQIY